MLWYKSWLETRSRFFMGLVLMTLGAAALVRAYPELVKLLPMARTVDTAGELGRIIKEEAELQATFRGFVWSQWYDQSLRQMWTLFAVAIGTGGLVSQTAGGAALYTLSLPVSRTSILGARAALGLAELFVLALVPSLVIPLASAAVGQTFSVGAVLVHGACLFVAGSVFFSLATFLSTVFEDIWRPALVAACAAVILAGFERFTTGLAPYGVVHAMSAELYFETGALPWIGLIIGAALSAGLLYGAVKNIEGRDF